MVLWRGEEGGESGWMTKIRTIPRRWENMTDNGRREEVAAGRESVLLSSSVSHLIPVTGSAVTHLSLSPGR